MVLEGIFMMCMCMEFGLCVEWYEWIVVEWGFMYIKVNGVNGFFLVSIFGNMVEWIEDEVVFLLMFFLVEVNNLCVSINNDFLFMLVLVFVFILVDLIVENIFVSWIYDGVLCIRLMSNELIVCESE